MVRYVLRTLYISVLDIIILLREGVTNTVSDSNQFCSI